MRDQHGRACGREPSRLPEGGPCRRSSGVHVRANDVSTPVLLERTGGEADRAAALAGRWSRVRDSGDLLAAYGMAMAAVVVFLRAPTGSLWQVGACAGLLF